MLTVWGRSTSSNVQSVMWCIGELGLACHRHDVGHRFGGTDSPEFLAMNPNGLVPVLRDGDGEPLWESGAILRYLAARYGEGPFWPADLSARAGVDKWAEWSKLNVSASFTGPIFWPLVRLPAAELDHEAVDKAVVRLGKALHIAEAQLRRHAYLAGADFTLADVAFGYLLYRYFTLPIDRPDQPALRAYYDGLTRRPAYRNHVMVSYEELRAG